jgi:hypothetical protein
MDHMKSMNNYLGGGGDNAVNLNVKAIRMCFKRLNSVNLFRARNMWADSGTRLIVCSCLCIERTERKPQTH